MKIRKHNEPIDFLDCACGNKPVAVIDGEINCHHCGNEVVFCKECLTELIEKARKFI